MVKNTPIVTTTTVQAMLSGTLAAIATPAVAPRIVAASHSHARRVDASADPAMTTYAVHATRRLCSLPNNLAIRPAARAATATCIARAVVGARLGVGGGVSEPVCAAAGAALAGSAALGGTGVAVANAVAYEADWATSSSPPIVVSAASAVSG